MLELYVFLWAVITSSIFILFLHLMLRDTSLLLRTGLGFFAVCSILCIARLAMPVEFSFFQRRIEYPEWISNLMKTRYLFHSSITLEQGLLIFSLTISLVLLMRFVYRTGKVKRVLSEHSKEDSKAEEILRTIDADCHLPVRRNILLGTPVIIGYRHPVIYIPEGDFTGDNLTDILRHEYTHWKRGHLWAKLVLQMVTILFWWDPFIYLLQQDISHIIEMICDEYAMHAYQPGERLHYMGTLLSCLRHSAGMETEPGFHQCELGFATSINGYATKQRVTYHLNKKEESSRQKYLIGLLYLAVFCWVIISYYVILKPAYTPEGVEEYSNETNAYLVECPDGTYDFYYDGTVLSVPAEDVKKELYYPYTIIAYEEYKELDSYKETESYQRFLEGISK